MITQTFVRCFCALIASWIPLALLAEESRADALVHQLRELPAPMPAPIYTGGPFPEGESPPVHVEDQKRWQLYNKLHDLGGESVLALARGLHDPDLRLRRNITLALGFLAEPSPRFSDSATWLDIRAALPALIVALKDRDELVRAWAADDVGKIGPDAVSAVPALIRLLSRDDPIRASACSGLSGIGPGAKSALPVLRQLLADPDPYVRKMATLAIAAIEG